MKALHAAPRADPYVHPKLASVTHQHTDEGGKPIGPTIVYTGLEPAVPDPLSSSEAGDGEDDTRH
jgi:hypothetical protein